MRTLVMMTSLLALSACAMNDFTPREKVARYDRETDSVEFPYPCPDWSHDSNVNYDNSMHSNFGCAANNNLAQQVVDPRDLERGSATANSSPDTETTIGVVERYRAGDIPAELAPMQE